MACSGGLFLVFYSKFSLSSPGQPQNHHPPASAFLVLGLQKCTTASVTADLVLDAD